VNNDVQDIHDWAFGRGALCQYDPTYGPPEPLGDRLRRARRKAGMSLAEAGKAGHLPAVVIGSYERHDRQPGIVALMQLAALYEVLLRDLLDNVVWERRSGTQ
jgi:transcriptional regulator with XRE-family HTH domain